MNEDVNKTAELDNREAQSDPSADPRDEGNSASAQEDGNYAQEISLEEFENLKSKAAKADEHWGQFVRVSADFDNYKKRAARERQEAIRFANEALLERLIPVLDNFEMALQAANDPKAGNTEALKTGVSMIHSQLKGVMSEAGLEEIDATDKAFDPNFHEAVSQQETADVPEGRVVQQLRKGYKLRDRLVRPASVIVAKKAAT